MRARCTGLNPRPGVSSDGGMTVIVRAREEERGGEECEAQSEKCKVQNPKWEMRGSACAPTESAMADALAHILSYLG